MDIQATNPVVVPPVPQHVYDLWIIPQVTIEWMKVTDPMTLIATFQSARRNEAGQMEAGNLYKSIEIQDLWALAAQDAEVASAMTAFIAALTKVAKASGTI